MFRSLEKRFVVCFFLPVALLLAAMGAAGFFYARNFMLAQWEESAVLRLQRAAHFVDMRLAKPKELVGLYLATEAGARGAPVREAILDQIRGTPGVLAIDRRIHDRGGGGDPHAGAGSPTAGTARFPMHGGGMRPRPHGMEGEVTVTPPRFDTKSTDRTVSIAAEVRGASGELLESLEVVMDFPFLIEDLPQTGWWETQKAFLLDASGRVLVGSGGDDVVMDSDLERATVEAIRKRPSGTLRGKGHPPDEISGFHHLTEAPWAIAVFAPGREILTPIVRFRNTYLTTLALFMLPILFLVRRAVSRITRSVKSLSAAAANIAQGRFSGPLPVESTDEIGELVDRFNTMSTQLRERLQMKRSLDLAKEVQQNLIPSAPPAVEGLDIAGASRFCDETGGDYYDFIRGEGPGSPSLRVIIGDVAGHGIASALLMSGVRSALRQRSETAGDLETLLDGVNRQIVEDVGDSGRFMTLFCLDIEMPERAARWIRAGHEPALLYRAGTDRWESLQGEGVPLGVSGSHGWGAYTLAGLEAGDILVLATDGVWEIRSQEGTMLGKSLIQSLLRDLRHRTASEMLDAVFEAIERHARGRPAADDMTLILIKVA